MPSLPDTLASAFRTYTRNLPPAALDGIMAPADGQSRIVTALFTILPGPHADAGGLVEAMLGIICRHEGRIDRFIGDGLLAVFGVHRAHEDDPERAVLCASELRDALRGRGLEPASGIGTGQVAFGLMDPDEHHESGIMGPVAAQAMRLGSRAARGEILVDGPTRRLVIRSFDLPPGPEDGAWRVGRRLPHPEKARGLEGMRAAIVGRDEELAQLRAGLAAAVGGDGRVAFVTGEAGLGKSRLAAELRAMVAAWPGEDPPPRWLEGRCVEAGGTTAFGPFIDLIDRLIAAGRRSPDEDRAGALTGLLEVLQRDELLSAERVDEIGPLLGRMLSLRFGTAWDDALARARPEQIRHQTLHAIRDLLLALAMQRPSVVALDDLHWSDPLSLDAITLLLESVGTAPLLLVCLYRPDADPPCSILPAAANRACPGRAIPIVLRSLDRPNGFLLVRSLFAGSELPASLEESILARSDGNPFFIEEAIRSLMETGAVRRHGDRWETHDDASTATVPRTLQSLILSRVDRLDADARRLLEVAAVIGAALEPKVLETAAEAGPSFGRLLDQLQSRALLVSDDAAPGESYAFKHVLTRQAVYQATHRRRRDRLHGKVAAAIEALYTGSVDSRCEDLAHHHEEAGHMAKAVTWVVRAARKAHESYLEEVAVEHLRHALALLASSQTAREETRLDILVELGGILENMGRHDPAEATIREAADLARRLARPPREIARIAYWLVRIVGTRHRPVEYLPYLEESIARLGNDPECDEAITLGFLASMTRFELGDPGEACRYATRWREALRSMPYTPERLDDYAVFPMLYSLDKNDREAMDWLAWVERQAGAHNDLLGLAAAHVRRGRDVLAQQGDRVRSIEALEQAIEIYGRIGTRYRHARCHLYLGDVQYRFGRLDEAASCLRRAREIAAGLEGHDHLRAESGMLEGQIALGREDPSAALASFRTALERKPGDQWRWFLLLLSGCAQLDLGKQDDALRCFMTALEATLPFRLPPAFSVTVDLAYLLSLVDRCGDGDAYRIACDRVAARRPEAQNMLAQWHLVPAEPRTLPRLATVDTVAWSWNDPFGDCARGEDGGIVLGAVPGRGLRGSNLSAPRLQTMVSGAFALQARCSPGSRDRPAVGGLVVWKDERTYLRLDIGSMSPGTVLFGGCIENRDMAFGRGRIESDDVCLRLERVGSSIRALCSVDGGEWFSVGEVGFPVDDPLQACLFVDGAIRPEIYPRSFCNGSAIQFTEVELSAGG